jgi:hypothetical protein
MTSTSGCALSPNWSGLQGGTGSSYDQVIVATFMTGGPGESAIQGAYYPLTDAPTSTGAKNLLTNASAPLSATGVAMTGKAASFNGEGGYIDVGTDFDFLLGQPSMPSGLSAFTLEAWVLAPATAAPNAPDAAPSASIGQFIFGQGVGGSSPVGYDVTIVGGGTEADVALGLNGFTGGSGQNSCGVQAGILPGQGFYLVGEYNQMYDEFAVWVNGSMTSPGCQGDGSMAGALPQGTPLYIGADPNGMNNFVGEISHVAIYGGVNLTQQQIEQHYVAGGSGP